MATLQCLACGHTNNVGDESCASCATSLNVRLCNLCEAISAGAAERCHSCGTEFRDAARAPSPMEQTTKPYDQPVPDKALPAVWRFSDEPLKASRPFTALLVLQTIIIVAGGLAFYFYGKPFALPPASTSALAPQIATHTQGAVTPQKASSAEFRPASGGRKAIAPNTQAGPAVEAGAGSTGVTHTRGVAAAPVTASAAAPVVLKKKPAAAKAPAVPAIRTDVPSRLLPMPRVCYSTT